MKKTASILALAGLLVCAGPAAAKSIPYEGKTSSGHKIAFKLQREQDRESRRPGSA